jgi:hypothetical protein
VHQAPANAAEPPGCLVAPGVHLQGNDTTKVALSKDNLAQLAGINLQELHHCRVLNHRGIDLKAETTSSFNYSQLQLQGACSSVMHNATSVRVQHEVCHSLMVNSVMRKIQVPITISPLPHQLAAAVVHVREQR